MHIIGGKFKRRNLISPKGDHVRPTQSKVRESLFNRIQFSIEGATFLDLFAGSGIMGLEALSRGAKHVSFVDEHPLSIETIEENCTLLDVNKDVTLLRLNAFEALEYLSREGKTFDYIFCDPPYGKGYGEKVLELVDTLPLLNDEGTLWIEENCAHPKERALSKLSFIREKKMGRTFLREYT